jgi:zinc transport system substrate-binding protein
VVGLALLLALVVGGFWTVASYALPNNSGEKPTIYATFFPLYDFAAHVAGDRADVHVVTPAGEEAHEYEPSPQQLVGMQSADMVVYNGAGFEPWIPSFLKYYRHRAVAASSGMELLPVADDHDGGLHDPHFWLDPVLAAEATRTIRDNFVSVDPANSRQYFSLSEAYLRRLNTLDTAYRQGLASCRIRAVVTSHEVLRYVAKRYNFEVLSIAGINSSEEPSPSKLAELSKVIKQRGIDTILFESLVSPKLAATLARETGATTLVYDPIEGVGDAELAKGAEYLSIQESNLQVLRKAMKCQ